MKTDIQRPTGVLVLLYVGLALTLTATVVPFLASDVLADHVASGYPDYSSAQIDSAVTAWLTVLGVLGALGAVGWVLSILAVRARRWARAAPTLMLALGLAAALTVSFTPDTSGEVGLAPLFGGLVLLPSVAGAVAVVLLWRGGRPAQSPAAPAWQGSS